MNVLPTNGVDALDDRIEQVYRQVNMPFDIGVVLDDAKHLNALQMSDRVPWVEKLLELDYSLGPGGYALRFDMTSNPKTYAFFQSQKYDATVLQFSEFLIAWLY